MRPHGKPAELPALCDLGTQMPAFPGREPRMQPAAAAAVTPAMEMETVMVLPLPRQSKMSP